MSDLVSIPISKAVFERLQKLAIPLVDNPSTVIERLIGFWEARSGKGLPAGKAGASEDELTRPVKLWRSTRGDTLPVGAALRGQYMDKTYDAVVEADGIRFNGKLYANPTAAAVAEKNIAGTTGLAANTNGRDFWKVRDPDTGQWIAISSLRMLSELAQGSRVTWKSE
jgi:hypothetical protein